jgi:hypothetical protein
MDSERCGGVESIGCDQSAVAMRICAGLASSKLTLSPRGGTTGRTTEGKYLFLAEFFFHGERNNASKPSAGMVNLAQFYHS